MTDEIPGFVLTSCDNKTCDKEMYLPENYQRAIICPKCEEGRLKLF